MTTALHRSQLKSLPLLHSGKVRDIYEVDAQHLLIVTTDRLSAFDVIMPTAVPGKGVVLTAISNFWFQRHRQIISNHIVDLPLASVLADEEEKQRIDSRAIIVKRLKPLPIEAIVRGYLIGSGWKEYRQEGSVCGVALPPGLQLADALPEPIFTPSTKADVGAHDENINFATMCNIIGNQLAEQVRDVSLKLYRDAAEYALAHGIIIADTKFEFGVDEEGKLIQIDESLTPDSSRFWPADQYRPGENPPSFDKQYVRDWLETIDWDKQEPGPMIPDDVIQQTSEKYQAALARLIAT
ncbi:MAG: phosphoribosylaminoimidazolesuccinocarboxamide synthase [Mariprofundaceae bacterium]